MNRTKALIAIAITVAIALPSGGYILAQQRLASPFAKRYEVKAAFASATAVIPGLGEPVTVAGVHVGQILDTRLKDGQGVVRMEIDPGKLRRVYTNARAVLVANTPLKDMQIDIAPGGGRGARPLANGGTIPLAQTTTPVDSDELLAALDTDTRTWLRSLLTDADIGTRGRGRDLNAILRAVGPTTQQVHRISALLAARRERLARLVHNLGVLTHAVSDKDPEVARVVDAGNATLAALAGQDVALRRSIAGLPGTLSTARHVLRHVHGFTTTLNPALRALMPVARRLPATLTGARTVFQGTTLLSGKQVRPFTAAVLPLARTLPETNQTLARVTPPLMGGFKVLQYTTNELAYNPHNGNPGYLYWLSWFAHNLDSVTSTEDAHGAAMRGLALFSCSSLVTPAQGVAPALANLLGQALGATTLCKSSTGGSAP